MLFTILPQHKHTSHWKLAELIGVISGCHICWHFHYAEVLNFNEFKLDSIFTFGIELCLEIYCRIFFFLCMVQIWDLLYTLLLILAFCPFLTDFLFSFMATLFENFMSFLLHWSIKMRFSSPCLKFLSTSTAVSWEERAGTHAKHGRHSISS